MNSFKILTVTCAKWKLPVNVYLPLCDISSNVLIPEQTKNSWHQIKHEKKKKKKAPGLQSKEEKLLPNQPSLQICK